MSMGIKANAVVKFQLRPRGGIMEETSTGILTGLIEWVQLVVREVVKPPPMGSPYDTGHNRRSVGWMISPYGESGFGTLKTLDLGEQSTRGLRTTNDSPVVAIATSSGYGGWLEIGTTKMPARPYVVPNVVRMKRALDKFLHDTV